MRETTAWKPENSLTVVLEHDLVTTEAYERARRKPTDFLLKPGHAKPEFETVVDTYETFVSVP